jgi:predicted RNase H-like HicB family nuclease
MTSKRHHEVAVRPDPKDARFWLANVVGEPGAHTHGRSLAEAKQHAVEVVALWSGLEPDAFEIEWSVVNGA